VNQSHYSQIHFSQVFPHRKLKLRDIYSWSQSQISKNRIHIKTYTLTHKFMVFTPYGEELDNLGVSYLDNRKPTFQNTFACYFNTKYLTCICIWQKQHRKQVFHIKFLSTVYQNFFIFLWPYRMMYLWIISLLRSYLLDLLCFKFYCRYCKGCTVGLETTTKHY
jgi:hypothetical protein